MIVRTIEIEMMLREREREEMIFPQLKKSQEESEMPTTAKSLHELLKARPSRRLVRVGTRLSLPNYYTGSALLDYSLLCFGSA